MKSYGLYESASVKVRILKTAIEVRDFAATDYSQPTPSSPGSTYTAPCRRHSRQVQCCTW
ncbi:hypothetical protein L210DRAFT_3565827 [Boletus edulis BED1]|uniref:Uncharacterized protein n=1 Tax=Boletus edulis BED1 TaxID=1328754 RepID=A0AAD4BGA0_BOLED|nr:hypothetical protein L210DRAFT_3565827 [Boletus edulis BED1]